MEIRDIFAFMMIFPFVAVVFIAGLFFVTAAVIEFVEMVRKWK